MEFQFSPSREGGPIFGASGALDVFISILALAGGRSGNFQPPVSIVSISILALAGGRSRGHRRACAGHYGISILALAGGRSAKMDAMRVAFFHICHKV